MQTYRRMLKRRVTLSLIDWLAIVILLTIWMVTSKPVPTEKAISYIKAPSHILVQLAELPELAEAETHPDPQWTVYGDGTLIYITDASDTFWRAQLAPSDIQHILKVIIHQHSFFQNTAQQYGSPTSDMVIDQRFLTVDANGQQKQVRLMGEPTNTLVSDIQTTHVFAIEEFLLAYHPLHPVFYAPNPDSEHDSDNDNR